MSDYVSKEEVAGWFSIDVQTLEGAKILYGYYTYEDYSGDAYVLFSKNGKLYEVSGGHCSCYGLEGQWSEEETSAEAIEKRYDNGYGYARGAEKSDLQKALDKWKAAAKRRSKKK